MTTRHDIQAKLAATVNALLGTKVEVTMMGGDADRWCVCGDDAEVKKAVAFLCKHCKMAHLNTEHDAELAESFAYLAA